MNYIVNNNNNNTNNNMINNNNNKNNKNNTIQYNNNNNNMINNNNNNCNLFTIYEISIIAYTFMFVVIYLTKYDGIVMICDSNSV